MKFRLQDLIDIEHFQDLQDRMNKIIPFPSSIIDNDGNILTATAWQDICIHFHRKNKETQRNCIKSDQYIKEHIHEANPGVSYVCPHGLVDNAIPIIIEGVHYGNFFTGQFFLEKPDLEFFRAQAQKYGFEENAYLGAVKKVPIWNREQVELYLSFVQTLISIISESGLRKLKEIESRKLIQKREERYRSILEAALDGFWITDTSGKLLEVNSSYVRMSGYSEDELLNMSIADLEVVETPSSVAEHMQKVIRKEEDLFESRHRRKDGTVIDVEVSVQFRAAEGGQCICFLRDITDRKRIEESLLESKAFLENMSDLAYIADDRGNVLWVNSVSEKLLGFSPEYVIGKPFKPFFIKADHASLMDVYQRTLEGESLQNTLTFISGVTCHFTSLPKKNRQGDIIGTFGVARDISERLAAEKLLKTSEERLKIAQKMARVGNWEYDIATGRVWGSEEAFLIYGIERKSEFIPLDLVEEHIIDSKRVNQALEDLINKNKTYDIEFKIKNKKKGEFTHIHSVAEQVCDPDGKLEKVIGVIQDVTEYHQIREEVSKREEVYRNLLNNLTSGVVVHSPDTSIILANPAALRMLGISNDTSRGIAASDPIWNFCRDDGSEMPLEEYPVNRVLSTKKVLKNQIVGVERSEDGNISWLLVDGFPLFKDSGEIEQIIINFIDITEIRQNQQAVLELNARMNLAADSAEFGVWDLDIRKNFLEWDDWMFRLYGISRDQFGGAYEAWQAVVHPDDMDRSNKEVEEALKGEKDFDTEFRIVRPDGQIRHIKAYATVSRDSQGEPVKMTGINYDITEMVNTIKALKESEERFHVLHNASFGGVAIHDKGIILECNKALSDITGYTYDELIGMNQVDLISDETRETLIENVEAGFERPYTVTGVRNNGELYSLRLEAREIPYRGKDVQVVEFRDISERKRLEKEREELEERLLQAQKLESVGRLAGGVAHDFNNMIAVINGYTDMALEEVDQDAPIYEGLKEIKKAGDRASNLTRQLLAFARKQTISPRLIDINHGLEDLSRMLKRLIGEDVELSIMPAKEALLVMMDPSQIDQILANLCVNARDSIADVGKITIETAAVKFDETYCKDHPGFIPGEYVLLQVRDNGCGMDAETLSNIFEPFFTTKASGSGTGLGLATVYGIVKQNSGFINVKSEPGLGTAFDIYLPRHKVEADSSPKMIKKLSTEGGDETILLVEDESSILKLMQKILKGLGYNVLAVRTAAEAIRIASNGGEIHLLLTDVVMPEMNGKNLAEAILSSHPDIRIIYMSGYTADVIAHHGVLEEGVDFIQKPFTREQVAVKVRETLDRG